ncbi:MAG: chemotaxis protein CheX [Planctomycetota bacterium]
MDKTTEKILAETAEEVLASLAFTFVMPGEQETSDEDVLKTKVGFSGPFNGTLSVAVPVSLVPQLAQNMLGLEGEECPETAQHDAIRELLNVICGNLLPRLAGCEPVFNLTQPKLVNETEDEAGDRYGPEAKVRLPLDEGWVELALVTDRKNTGAGCARDANPGAARQGQDTPDPL